MQHRRSSGLGAAEKPATGPCCTLLPCRRDVAGKLRLVFRGVPVRHLVFCRVGTQQKFARASETLMLRVWGASIVGRGVRAIIAGTNESSDSQVKAKVKVKVRAAKAIDGSKPTASCIL